MPHFSQSSDDKLDTATYDLQRLFNIIIQFYDCTIIQGWRSLSEQAQLFRAGRSKVQNGKHNTSPSQAVDVAPYIQGRGIVWPQTPTDWNNAHQRQAYIKDVCQFYHFAGFVEGVAAVEDIKLTWGGDWDRDHEFSDQTFDDLVHFESTAPYSREV
jgi:hypothetical protein